MKNKMAGRVVGVVVITALAIGVNGAEATPDTTVPEATESSARAISAGVIGVAVWGDGADRSRVA